MDNFDFVESIHNNIDYDFWDDFDINDILKYLDIEENFNSDFDLEEYYEN